MRPPPRKIAKPPNFARLQASQLCRGKSNGREVVAEICHFGRGNFARLNSYDTYVSTRTSETKLPSLPFLRLPPYFRVLNKRKKKSQSLLILLFRRRRTRLIASRLTYFGCLSNVEQRNSVCVGQNLVVTVSLWVSTVGSKITTPSSLSFSESRSFPCSPPS
jgi:hypothetical protein